MGALLTGLYDHYQGIVEQIETIEDQMMVWHKGSEVSQRLSTIPGIGIITATAFAGTVGSGAAFRNGRELSAYLGLVPSQASSGGKTRLLGISKRGDGYLRMLLVHGARSVLRSAQRRDKAGLPNPYHWLSQLSSRTHTNKACVAQANKTARIAWCVLTRGQSYRDPLGA